MSFFQLPSFIQKKQKIDHALEKLIQNYDENTNLKKAIEYSFFNGGKRIRPVMVLMLQEALNCPYDIIESAVSIELYHTASLIADDLPSMDNDNLRREHPACHVRFGDTVALLASYGLIALAFEKIHDCAASIRSFNIEYSEFSADACLNALKAASFSAGIQGATLGQYYDLFPNEDCSIEKLMYLKTVTLFEVAFLFGWYFGGGDISKVEDVKKLSYHLGMAYQIADDIQDRQSDEEKGKNCNYAIYYGLENAKEMFSFHLEEVKLGLAELKLNTEDFIALVGFLENYGNVQEKAAFV